MSVLATPAPATRSASDAFQGAWESVAGPRRARLLVAGRHFTFEMVGGPIYMGTFDLTSDGMDMHIEEGPAEHVGCSSRCLVHLEGGVLRWCPGRPGSDMRPTSFPDVDDARHLSLVFRRAGKGR